MKKLFIICFLGITAIVMSQEKMTNVSAVKQTIQNYYDGYIYRDINKLTKAFDLEHGAMKVPVTENKEIVGYRNRYFKELIPKWGNRKKLAENVLANCSLTILNVDVVDATIASAKIIMKVDTISYVDILSLHNIKRQWKITNKIYAVRK